MEWFYADKDDSKQAFEEDDLGSLVEAGTIQADTLIWTEGLGDWTACSQVRPDLFPQLAAQPPALEAGPSHNPPALAGGHYGDVPRPPDNLATTSLVCGIVGFLLSGCYGIGLPVCIVGVVMAHKSRTKTKELFGPHTPMNGMSIAGMILGYIGLAISVFYIAIVLIYLIFFGVMIGAGGLTP